MRDQRLGGEPALDQPRRRGRLHDNAGARPAGQLRPPRHQHAELRGNDIEPLGGVFADHRHHRGTARAGHGRRRHCHLDPGQVRRQRAAARPALGRTRLAQRRVALLDLCLALRDSPFELLQAQLQLIVRQPLRLAAELQAFEPQQQVVQPLVLLHQGVAFRRQRSALGDQCLALGQHRHHQRTQALRVSGQGRRCVAGGGRHAANPTQPPSVSESPARSAPASNQALRTGLRTAPGRA